MAMDIIDSESSYLADQVLADLPPQMVILDSYSESSATLTAHMWQTKCRQIYPH